MKWHSPFFVYKNIAVRGKAPNQRSTIVKVRKTTDGGVLRLRLTVPALPPEHLRSARREEPPGQDSLTIVSPERATEYVTCLITTCLWLCRPFRTFSVVATLPGVVTPVCGLSSLRDFWQAPISCYSLETPMREDLKGRERNFPRTAIFLFTFLPFQLFTFAFPRQQ